MGNNIFQILMNVGNFSILIITSLLLVRTIIRIIYNKIKFQKLPNFLASFYIIFLLAFLLFSTLQTSLSWYLSNTFYFASVWNTSIIFYGKNLLLILSFLYLQIFLYEVTALKTDTSQLPRDELLKNVMKKLKTMKRIIYFFTFFEIFVQSLIAGFGVLLTSNILYTSELLTTFCIFSAYVCMFRLYTLALVRKKVILNWSLFTLITIPVLILTFSQDYIFPFKNNILYRAAVSSSLFVFKLLQTACLTYAFFKKHQVCLLYDDDLKQYNKEN